MGKKIMIQIQIQNSKIAMAHGGVRRCATTIFPPSKFKNTNGAPWPILMAHQWCAISIPDTNGAPVVRH